MNQPKPLTDQELAEIAEECARRTRWVVVDKEKLNRLLLTIKELSKWKKAAAECYEPMLEAARSEERKRCAQIARSGGNMPEPGNWQQDAVCEAIAAAIEEPK